MYLYDSPASFPRSQNLRPSGTLSRFGEPTAPSPDLILDDFDLNKADLKQSHKNKIDQLAQQIVDSWKPASTRPALGVSVVGHTDEAGSVAYNLDLGRRRAEKVLGRLTGLIINGDIDLYQRMTWSRTSKGEASRRSSVPAQNRRVEIFIQWGKAPAPPPPPRPPVTPKAPFDKAACHTFCDENKACCMKRTRFGGVQCHYRLQVCRQNCDQGRRWHFDTDCRRG
jgi:OmpA family